MLTVVFRCLIVVSLLLGGCGDDTQHSTTPKVTPPKTTKPLKARQPAKAAPLPKKATPGDVLPPPPTLPRRLASGSGPAPQLPNISCARMAPDGTFKLSRRIEVGRRGAAVSTTLGTPTRKGDKTKAAKTKPGTLELCLFHKWRARERGENRTHTGRIHHFVAAFPGSDVSSWTADELTRIPKKLPTDARYLSAGWAALLPTGLPDRPAIAVISGRFYDGILGEEVHYIRKARVLQRHRGRWAWVPWMSRTYQTLDTAHLRTSCKRSGGAGCRRWAARIAGAERGAARRLKIRDARLKRKGKTKVKKGDPDPQSYWISEAQHVVREGRWKEAIDLALKSEVVCGEAGRRSRRVIGRALRMGKIKPEIAEPAVNRRPLCEPLSDKPAPKVRKLSELRE
ncbi:MAG: hypothetical protein KC502_18930 [Myxococcales bacterium]|nr:hypothetical protein [Myxococcales bacterium]